MIIRAKKYAAYCLSRKNLTEKELYDKLKEKGYEEYADEVIDEFKNAGFVNDREYAFMYISDGVNIKYKGLFRLGEELLKKGISKSIISSVSKDFEEDSFNSLMAYVHAHYDGTEISDRREKEKIRQKLLRRGYSYGEIRNCFDEMNWSDI